MRHKLNPTFSEFMRALVRPTTYNITKNKHIVFGLIMGVPFPALMLWQDFICSNIAFTLRNLASRFTVHPYHYFFIFFPFLTGIVIGAFGTIRRKSKKRISSLIAKLEAMSLADTLTDLFNRRHFEEELAKEFQRASRNSSPFAIISMDMDNLKELNDTEGHPVGDNILRAIGLIVNENSRLYDVPARLGGDEFMVLLPNTTEEEALVFAERLHEHISRHDFTKNGASGKMNISVSIGVANYPLDGKEVSQVTEAADRALYAAKKRGKDCVCSSIDENNLRIRST